MIRSPKNIEPIPRISSYATAITISIELQKNPIGIINTMIVAGLFLLLVVVLAVLGYIFIFKKDEEVKKGNKITTLDFEESYRYERNTGAEPFKTRIVTREAEEDEEEPPEPITTDDFYIKQIFVVAEDDKTVPIWKDGDPVESFHTVDTTKDKLGVDIMVTQKICDGPKVDTDTDDPHGCLAEQGTENIDGTEYTYLGQNEDTLFSDLNTITEDGIKYYELPIRLNADHTVIVVIKEELQ